MTALRAAAPAPAPHGRRKTRRARLRCRHFVAVWAVLTAPLCWWGLPGSERDGLLFGGEPPWPLERYAAARAAENRSNRIGGADTDLDPIANRAAVVELTQTESDRAAILLRYRLYSRQPDEMITFMALQRMRPRQLDFDPRLYQYGGAYIYLIGACCSAASLLGLTRLTSDLGVYLADPELFGRFFLVARFVSLAFGAAALLAIAKLARRAGGGRGAWCAVLLAATCPVFITGTLEAKPHLPAASLLLWCVHFALEHTARPRAAAALAAGALGGLAFGFVLTGLVAAAAIGALALMRATRRGLLLATLAFAVAYAATNPYVIYNALFNRAALTSNLSNSTAMYTIDRLPAGAIRVAELLVEAAGVGVVAVGAVGALWLLRRWPRQTLIAAAPAAALLAITIALGAGKPAEFGRFLLLPAVLLALAGGALLARLTRRRWFLSVAVLLIAVVSPATAYWQSFVVDAWSTDETRRSAGAYLATAMQPGDGVAVAQEPAPYSIPPLDFGRRRVLLLPRGAPPEPRDLPRWLVLTADDERSFSGAWWLDHYRLERRYPQSGARLSPIAWANKPVFIFRLRVAP